MDDVSVSYPRYPVPIPSLHDRLNPCRISTGPGGKAKKEEEGSQKQISETPYGLVMGMGGWDVTTVPLVNNAGPRNCYSTNK
jgi:hypothetical protein